VVGSLILLWMVDAEGIIGATIQNIFNDPNLSMGLRAADVDHADRLRHLVVDPVQLHRLLRGLQTVPEDTMEAAMIDGASKWQRMRHVVVPHLMPLVVFITLIQLMDNFRVFEPIVSFQAEAYAQSLSYDHLQ
jgi:ABC-type molybdate transport system permease subunit